VGDQTRDGVGRAARNKRHHQVDLTVRKRVSGGDGRRGKSDQAGDCCTKRNKPAQRMGGCGTGGKLY
jgi:hypothetical protein